ncbi:MAG TPA: HAD-IA family hydrolase [Candidatus Cloacimonas acidaminovorans]|jgi:phosphoglycolate phosphatase|nr:HAD-IA family hydrolase [Candidatus Cloacimonas acidaminovorans]HRS60224.1 HAD-IA family hydrolase [Candidatus Cloacimonas sp.]HOM79677.1 HAD-IA family hydrolase [Candidatus Cloacimonas acidaminovorans]HOS07518.1 HAD-IA family hydrolase [Candidatus Cloacimonas acidaminovorans]HOT38616.1 HAD-IA family hydrolase [Candidatus Cloacimonas acidaminovorans]
MKPFLLFDFDGTIADSLQLGLKIANNLAPQFGYPPFTENDIQHFRSLTWHKIAREMQIPFYKIPKIVTIAFKEYKRLISELEPCAGIVEMINELALKEIPMALLSSNTVENVHLFLTNHKIDSFLWIEGTSGILNKAKDIKKRLKKHKISTNEVIYIGDEIRDIEAAHNCGLKVIAVTWGFHTAEFLASYKPDYLVNEPKEIVEIVNRLTVKSEK